MAIWLGCLRLKARSHIGVVKRWKAQGILSDIASTLSGTRERSGGCFVFYRGLFSHCPRVFAVVQLLKEMVKNIRLALACPTKLPRIRVREIVVLAAHSALPYSPPPPPPPPPPALLRLPACRCICFICCALFIHYESLSLGICVLSVVCCLWFASSRCKM